MMKAEEVWQGMEHATYSIEEALLEARLTDWYVEQRRSAAKLLMQSSRDAKVMLGQPFPFVPQCASDSALAAHYAFLLDPSLRDSHR